MSDFSEMAAQARAGADKKIADEKAQRQRERDEWNAKVQSLEEELEKSVLPTLLSAQAAFAQQDIPVSVERSWETHRTETPSVTFQCEGPRMPNAWGGYGKPSGDKFKVFHERGDIVVRLERQNRDGIGGFGGSLEDALRSAIKHSLETYTESLVSLKTRE